MSKSVEALSATELIVQCSSNTDPAYWKEFVSRYHRRIMLSALRVRRSYGYNDNEQVAMADLTQEIYLRLLANNCSVLRDFRGDNEISLISYLNCVVHSVVTDQLRRELRQSRLGDLISLDAEQEKEVGGSLINQLPAAESTSPDRMLSDRLAPAQLKSLLKMVLSGNNAARDSLVFQLHTINGLSMREIAQIESLKMTLVNVEQVVRRTRERLRSVLTDSNSTIFNS